METGERFGRYTIVSVLGRGGMGCVYVAATPDGERVALKLMLRKLASDGEYRRRFQRESALADKVSHPNVVPVLDRGEIDGVLYIAQRFIEGRSLREELNATGGMSLRDLVGISRQLGSGLSALHHAGLVHRDVKPDNIIVDFQGDAYLTDLGLAKDRAASSILTQFGQAIGTMDYMAPEQIRGTNIDARADVYGMGCVMFECIAGKPPFSDQRGMRLMWAHMRDAPPNPCADRDDVPPEVGWAVLKALAKEPEERLPSATALARLIEVGARLSPVEEASA
jgi:serine/threonine-protein kinase